MIRSRQQPPLSRTSMAYRPFRAHAGSNEEQRRGKVLTVRRSVFFILVAVSTFIAGSTFATILGADGLSPLSWTIIGIFIFLFGWISFNFWTIIFGFVVALHKTDKELVLPGDAQAIAQATRIALIMPVYNEEMARIYSALRAIYDSLKETGQLETFDIYI